MALPSIKELMRPVLEAHGEGEVLRSVDLIPRVAAALAIPDAEQAERQPSGDNTLVQRLNWARNNLVRTGLLDQPAHGQTVVTPRGLEVVREAGDVDLPPSDWAARPVSRASVLAAMSEFDRDGRDVTLKRHGFRRALDYVIDHDSGEYDAKAVYGIAYGIEYPDEEPIRNRGLSGGHVTNRRLEALGFTI
jgi:hypothetical protein